MYISSVLQVMGSLSATAGLIGDRVDIEVEGKEGGGRERERIAGLANAAPV